MPHGWLRNGNPPGDFLTAPRCGARNRRGLPCQCPAMRGRRRCRVHGGLSTGAKTDDGKERCRLAAIRSHRYSREGRAARFADREARAVERAARAYLRSLFR